MLDTILIEPTEKTPHIHLDVGLGQFRISGRSLPENSLDFYQPILTWIDDYSQMPNSETNFEFHLEYMNTSSSKAILDILSKLEDIDGSRVTWYTDQGDDDMKSAGLVLSELVDIHFDYLTPD